MATKTIAWKTGSGNITLTYTGQGNGSITVSSAENDSFDDRSQSINITTTAGSPKKSVSVSIKQKGKILPIGTVYNFNYSGSVQQVTLPKGKYKLQCWGAQGGNVTGTYAVEGSKGGYSEGVLTLTKTTTLYIFVGGQGVSYTSSETQTSTSVVNGGWNGGGAGRRTSLYNSGGIDGRSFPRGGGGGTDIALVTSSMSYSSGRTARSTESLKSRIIVAGGGGGASARYTVEGTYSETLVTALAAYYESSTQVNYSLTAHVTGGKTYVLKGTAPSGYTSAYVLYYSNGAIVTRTNNLGIGVPFTVPSGYTFSSVVLVFLGATTDDSDMQLYEVVTTSTSSTSKSTQRAQGGGTSGKGAFPGGQKWGGTGASFGLGTNQTSTTKRYCGGGGGGGWYGGGTDSSDDSADYISYTGGGSGFVNTSANSASRPSGYTGLELDSGTTKDGSTSFESTSGGTETGHSGNGYARITVLE